MFTTPTFRTVAAGSALALAAAGGAMLASPATAATSETLNYTCTFGALGDKAATATHTVPDTVVYGGMVPVSTTVTVPADVAGFLYGAGAREVDGTATTYSAVAGGLVKIPVPQTIAKTPVPAAGTMDVVAVGNVDTAPFAGAVNAGDVVDVALDDRADAADIEASLSWYAENSTDPQGPISVPCELGDGQNLAVGMVTIVQAGTETNAKLTYKKAKKMLVGKANVDAPESGADLAGKVKFILKKNGKAFKTATKDVNAKGIATVKWAKIKKGNYKLVTKYLGTENFTKSSDSATKKV